MDEEKVIWQGNPSQVINLPAYLLCALAAGVLLGGGIFLGSRHSPALFGVAGAAIIPVVIALWKWVQTASRRYEITTERLRLSQGLLSRRTDAVELYRVKDYVLMEPLSMRLVGLGDIVLATDDEVNPKVVIRAIPHPRELQDQIRKHVEICRDKKRVRVTEFEGGGEK